jgi:hypothetical protein
MEKCTQRGQVRHLYMRAPQRNSWMPRTNQHKSGHDGFIPNPDFRCTTALMADPHFVCARGLASFPFRRYVSARSVADVGAIITEKAR